jgi:hypothetical protein
MSQSSRFRAHSIYHNSQALQTIQNAQKQIDGYCHLAEARDQPFLAKIFRFRAQRGTFARQRES